MIGRWSLENTDSFVRDLLRDFCSVYAIVTEQEQRFARSQAISYAVLRDLLGEATHKGVFWRLKDTAHHLFRKKIATAEDCASLGIAFTQPHNECYCEEIAPAPLMGQKCSEVLVESMLDWCIGYAFHECCKLKEDAFQRQHYTNRLLQIKNRAEYHMDIAEALMPYTSQTNESIGRELERILGVLRHICQLFVVYLPNQEQNAPLALFLAKEEEFAKNALQGYFDQFIDALYAGKKGYFYLRAIKASLDGGHLQDALDIAEKSQEYFQHNATNDHECLQSIQECIATYEMAQNNNTL